MPRTPCNVAATMLALLGVAMSSAGAAPETCLPMSALLTEDGRTPPSDDAVKILLDQLQSDRDSVAHRLASAPIRLAGALSGDRIGAPRDRYDAGVQRILRLGPRALPSLLEHVECRSPIGVRLRTERLTLYRSNAMHVGSTPERIAALSILGGEGGSFLPPGPRLDPSEFEQMLAGDLCFELIGAIVNRRYAAFSYQPTDSALIQSPPTDVRIAAYLREMWGGDLSVPTLSDSLTRDSRRRDDWDLAAGGVERSLEYYPSSSIEPLQEFLRDARSVSDGDAETHRCLSAVLRSASRSADIRIVRIAREFTEAELDDDLFLAGVRSLELSPQGADEVLVQRIRAAMRSSYREHNAVDADEAFRVLVRLSTESTALVVESYLMGRGASRGPRLLHVIEGADSAEPWTRCALDFLLADTTPLRDVRSGQLSPTQVRHVAAAGLLESLGLGSVEPHELVDARAFDSTVARIRAAADPAGLCVSR